ncbi:hypothetical protein CLCR_10950 [Cladophialophora carrionii]|uniref:Uncharacterized protein n=1 Tax=Cladophialophora carrionii TaxID=86049 RepID=A0A1C1CWA8_9EURO|nr:hypothetical protein CLCR_10950 [Cladophialophora carrionii]
MFATDIGIAAQLSLLKETLIQREQQVTANKRIILVWQIEAEAYEEWVQKWMEDVLRMDTHSVSSRLHTMALGQTNLRPQTFQALLYVTGGFKSANSRVGQATDYGRRVKKYYECANFGRILTDELQLTVGPALVTGT